MMSKKVHANHDETSAKELTLGDIKSHTGQTNFEAVTYLNLFGCGISDVSKISLLKSLTVCLVANNYITDLAPLMSCHNIVKLDASTNKIRSLPSHEAWSRMRTLRILYLHDNAVSQLDIFRDLAGASSLNVLTMFDTPVSLTKHYRHHAVNTIWSLKCLDQLAISDEEVIEDAKFKDKFCAYHPELRIGHLPYITKDLSEHEAVAQSLRTLKLVEGVLRKHSPVIIIQRAWRGRLNKRRAEEFRELRHWAAVCIQRYWRLKHDIPQHPAVDKVEHATHGDLYSPISVVRRSVTPAPKVESPDAAVPEHKPSEDTVEQRERTPFRISSAVLLQNVKAKTSFAKVWGAVPFQAGLEGNVFAKRAGRLEGSEQGLESVHVPTGDEELQLIAERTELQQHNTFRDIVTSCREAGRVVREAANHYKEIQRYRPRTVKRDESRRPTGSNSQRLFTKMQDGMALSCLRAVQQAYKNRAQIEASAARMDQVLLQRHQHKVMLARVDAIKNAARIEALHQRELDDTKLREGHYKLHEKERKAMLEAEKKRTTELRLKKENKQYKQFMTDFCCQNASLSKALARHDRRTIKDDAAGAAQDKVSLLRDQNIRSQRTVKEYGEFVRLRRQAEAQYDRAQINTVLLEEKKAREQEVQERMEFIKALRSSSADVPPPTTNMIKRPGTSETEIVMNYKTAISNTKPTPLVRGRAINPSRGSQSSPSTKPEPPKHIGSIRFDLTIPDPGEASVSKASISSVGPARLTSLFLNDCPDFPLVPVQPRRERDILI